MKFLNEHSFKGKKRFLRKGNSSKFTINFGMQIYSHFRRKLFELYNKYFIYMQYNKNSNKSKWLTLIILGKAHSNGCSYGYEF